VKSTAPSAEALLRASGLAIPNGHSMVSLAERPDLIEPAADHNVTAWPDFMLEDPIANANFGRAWRDWPQFQFVLLDAAGEIVATNNAMPLAWDGSDDDLPSGWDAQVLRSVEALDGKTVPNTLGALQIVVARGIRGSGLSGTMVGAMRASARSAGYRAVIACVRPTLKASYPLTPIESYATWTRPDGLPFDPWIRLHVRLGGRIVRAAPESMTMRGTVAEWEGWTGLAFPESGRYAVPFATQPIEIDRDRDEGVYHDQNVWIVHDLA
jgi:hypothetical protein